MYLCIIPVHPKLPTVRKISWCIAHSWTVWHESHELQKKSGPKMWLNCRHSEVRDGVVKMAEGHFRKIQHWFGFFCCVALKCNPSHSSPKTAGPSVVLSGRCQGTMLCPTSGVITLGCYPTLGSQRGGQDYSPTYFGASRSAEPEGRRKTVSCQPLHECLDLRKSLKRK